MLTMPKEDDGSQEAEQIVRCEASPQGGRITVRQRKIDNHHEAKRKLKLP
jgi:hypothetical protein